MLLGDTISQHIPDPPALTTFLPSLAQCPLSLVCGSICKCRYVWSRTSHSCRLWVVVSLAVSVWSKEKFPDEETTLTCGYKNIYLWIAAPNMESESLLLKMLCTSITGKAQGPTSRNLPESLLPEAFHGTRRHHVHLLLLDWSCAEQCGFGGTTSPFPLWPCLLRLWLGVRGFDIFPGWKQDSCCLRHSAPARPSWPKWWWWSGPRLHFSLTSRWTCLFQPPVLSDILASVVGSFYSRAQYPNLKAKSRISAGLISLLKPNPNGTQVSLPQC